MARCARLAVGFLVLLRLLVGAVPDASADGYFTDITFDADTVYAAAYTWIDVWNQDEFVCVETQQDPESELYYCSREHHYSFLVRADAELWTPLDTSVDSGSMTVALEANLYLDAPIANRYGMWLVFASHYKPADVFERTCSFTACGEWFPIGNTPWFLGNTSASVNVPPPPPPGSPANPSPADGAVNVPTSLTLSWSASGATSYDIAFGTTNPPQTVATDLATASHTPAQLDAGTIYYWKVTAKNAGGSTPGPQWSFTTASAPPPGSPANPSPANGAVNVPTSLTLSWSASGATSYDIAFGTTNPPPTVATDLATASYTPAQLDAGTIYYWKVTAKNAGGSTPGPLWSFTTASTPPPGSPANPSPANGAVNVPTSLTLSWSASGATSYDIAFGTTNPPQTVATDLATASHTPAQLDAGTIYYWKVTAKNAGGSTPGPVWSFTTAGGTITLTKEYIRLGDRIIAVESPQ